MGLFYLIDMPAMGTALGSVKMAYLRTSSSLSISQSNPIQFNSSPSLNTGSGSIVFERILIVGSDCHESVLVTGNHSLPFSGNGF